MSDSMQPPSPPPVNPPPPSDPPPPPGYSAPGYGPPPGGSTDPLPWDDRERLGFSTALVDTIKLIATDPKDAFSRIRADGDYVGPFLFGLLIAWVMAVVGQMWSLLFSSVFSFGSASMFGDLEGLGLAAGVSVAQVLIMLIIFPFIFVIGLFIGSGIFHLCLMVVGALEHSETGFEGTFKVLCYSQVAGLAGIVPMIGGLIAMVLTILLDIVGFEQVHRTTTVKSALGTLIPIALCCVCIGIFVAFFGAAMAAALAQAASGG